MASNVVDVICFVFPNGDVFHAERTDDLDPHQVVAAWKDLHPQHAADAQLQGGFVHIRMRADDYCAIPATTESAQLFGARS